MEYLVIKLTGTETDNQKIRIKKALKNIPCAKIMEHAVKMICSTVQVDEIIESSFSFNGYNGYIRDRIAHDIAHVLVEKGFVTITKIRGEIDGIAYKYTNHVGRLTIITEERVDEDGREKAD